MFISKTRQKLISVARELFAKQGFDGITMNDIAQASQKGRRTMYTYFSSKEDIYYAVIVMPSNPCLAKSSRATLMSF